ncbi:hypothetical protein K7432_000852 [Basidiobolus ranarum]|uniref:RGS domain-containing protein n=1 Tax=Basidiobolus ranarum TaxID=34480 RepID=A0ABR2WAJ9_9FUNG
MEAYVVFLYVLGVLWIAQTVFICALIWRRRRYPCIRYRSPRMTLAAALGICVIVTFVIIRVNNPTTISCAYVVWVSGIVYPLIHLSTISRCIKLYFFYRISEAKLEDALVKMGAQPNMITKKPATFSFSKRRSHESVELRSLTQTNSADVSLASQIKPENILENDWFYQRRYIATPNYMSTWLLILVMFHGAVSAVVHLYSPKLNQNPTPLTDCYAGVEYIPRRAFCYFYGVVVIPFLICLMRNVNDAYGIRRELASATVINILGDTLLLVFVSWDKLRDAIDPDISGIIWTVVPMVIIYILLVVAPLFESYLIDLRKGKKSRHPIVMGKSIILDRTRDSFEVLLKNSNLLYQFKMFAVADFTVECVLFYEACERLLNMTNSASPEMVQEHLREIYEAFIAPHSKFQVNLTDDTIRQIRLVAKADIWEIDMYNVAITEVKELMFRNTYPRFLVKYHRGDSHWDDLIEGA